MPRLSQTETWVSEYRDLLRQSFAPETKWFVGEHRGSIRLEVKHNNKKQTRLLPYEWSKKGFSAAIPEIQQIYKRFYSGKTRQLSRACEETKVSNTNREIEFSDLIKEFRKFVPNASDQTWNKSYLPVLYKAKDLLDRTKHKPVDGEDLMMKALEQWEQGTRQRQIQRRSLNKFLNWAVLRAKLPSAYAPPATVPETRKPKKVGYAFSDQQILALIEDEKDEQWKFAYQLMAVYGLRPEELRYLRIIEGATGKELWSIYRKSKGGNKGERTEPRELNPLFVKDMDGKPINWKLQERLEIGEQLPPLGQEGAAGLAILTHIKRKRVYIQIKNEALNIGQHAVPYSFRHRYSKESHANRIPVPNVAASMGHSPQVHLSNYSRFVPDGTSDLYSKANICLNIRKENKGFSLLELIIVIAVLSIFTLIGLPSFIKLINTALLQAAKTSIVDCYKNCLNNPEEPIKLPSIPKVDYESTNCDEVVKATINNECQISMNMSNGLKTKWPKNYFNCVGLKNDTNADNNDPSPPQPGDGDDGGNEAIIECLAYGPGMCGNPPCGHPKWNCSEFCPGQCDMTEEDRERCRNPILRAKDPKCRNVD